VPSLGTFGRWPVQCARRGVRGWHAVGEAGGDVARDAKAEDSVVAVAETEAHEAEHKEVAPNPEDGEQGGREAGGADSQTLHDHPEE